MKKIIEFIKNNWIFLLFVIPFVFICFSNKEPDNDIWFLLNNGRYVFEHGIPYVDPFTIHEGLSFVMQQWLTALLFWILYRLFGYRSLLIYIYLISFLFMFLFYKLCYVVSNKKNISVIVSAIVVLLINEYIVLRPQVISYILLIFEVLLLELYIMKKNIKYLYFLPLISLALINFHASMWYFQFVFLLPFIINGIKIKKIKILNKLRIDDYKLRPILISMVIMIIAGFINPYGIDALTYIFKSYGIKEINGAVIEMHPMSWSGYNGKIIFSFLIIFMLINYLNKKLKLDIRHFLFICGITLLAFMHNKCYPIFVLIFTYALMYNINKLDIKFKFDNRYFKSLVNGLSIGLCVTLIGTFFYTVHYSYNMYSFNESYKMENIVQYILDNNDKKDVVLFTGFNTGGYTEFKGLKSYIDPRAELFFKKFNGKFDIFKESLAIEKDLDFDYDKFLKKYNFTHIIVYDFSYFNMYLEDCNDYELVYTENVSNSGQDLSLLLYERKDVEVLK